MTGHKAPAISAFHWYNRIAAAEFDSLFLGRIIGGAYELKRATVRVRSMLATLPGVIANEDCPM